ncbi:MAG: phosphatidylglycerophosphatase A [Deltaproteobacteria bacterium]|nr:phosphatidylglycerophosphatase A [Deltaproteobacteria bacterium]
MQKFWLVLATGFGTGFAPVASGTFGTLVGIPVVWLFGLCPERYALLVGAIVLLLLGVKAAAVAEKHYGQKDSGKIVIDEIVGYMVTMYMVPVSWTTILAGFFLFRLFDVIKLWPARQIDQEMGGGWGVMLDDVAAGVYANVALQLLLVVGFVR